MPKELVRIASGIVWRRTVIRPGEVGLETELQFDVDGLPFAVVLDSIPDKDFFSRLAEIRCLAVNEISPKERGWVEPGRYQVRINDDDEVDDATAIADRVRWGPDAAI